MIQCLSEYIYITTPLYHGTSTQVDDSHSNFSVLEGKLTDTRYSKLFLIFLIISQLEHYTIKKSILLGIIYNQILLKLCNQV